MLSFDFPKHQCRFSNYSYLHTFSENGSLVATAISVKHAEDVRNITI